MRKMPMPLSIHRSPDEKSNRMDASALLEFVRLVVDGELKHVSQRLSTNPALATMASPVGATRQEATNFFFASISHYLYAGDTALHMASAASCRPIAELLVSHGVPIVERGIGAGRSRCTTRRTRTDRRRRLT